MKSMRNLGLVIDQILEVAPDLEPAFKSIKNSIQYSAPELMVERWGEVTEILNHHAVDHPQREQIARIFSGPTTAG